MAYSQKVVDRFEDVLKNPEKHAVGKFDLKDEDLIARDGIDCLVNSHPNDDANERRHQRDAYASG